MHAVCRSGAQILQGLSEAFECTCPVADLVLHLGRQLRHRARSFLHEEHRVEAEAPRSGRPVGDPAVDWLGFKNTRVWKWGSYGTVASVVIEKPHLGDFLPLADCEFDLNYTPLLEYRRGRGLILFCQLDLCSRSEPEPVIKRVFENLLSYLENPFEKRSRRTIYVGGREGEELLKALKVRYELAPPSELRGGDLLIVGPGGGDALRAAADRVAEAVRKGMIVLCLGLDPDELEGWLPFEVRLARREVLFTPIGRGDLPFLRGIGPSELHWRGRIKIWAVEGVPEEQYVHVSPTVPLTNVSAEPSSPQHAFPVQLYPPSSHQHWPVSRSGMFPQLTAVSVSIQL